MLQQYVNELRRSHIPVTERLAADAARSSWGWDCWVLLLLISELACRKLEKFIGVRLSTGKTARVSDIIATNIFEVQGRTVSPSSWIVNTYCADELYRSNYSEFRSLPQPESEPFSKFEYEFMQCGRTSIISSNWTMLAVPRGALVLECGGQHQETKRVVQFFGRVDGVKYSAPPSPFRGAFKTGYSWSVMLYKLIYSQVSRPMRASTPDIYDQQFFLHVPKRQVLETERLATCDELLSRFLTLWYF